uniref:Uncharacterized protein n=1 Tax=Clastoptera arizonana TaxID=38151 RepID=A0A1B6C1R9_9HEMI
MDQAMQVSEEHRGEGDAGHNRQLEDQNVVENAGEAPVQGPNALAIEEANVEQVGPGGDASPEDEPAQNPIVVNPQEGENDADVVNPGEGENVNEDNNEENN